MPDIRCQRYITNEFRVNLEGKHSYQGEILVWSHITRPQQYADTHRTDLLTIPVYMNHQLMLDRHI